MAIPEVWLAELERCDRTLAAGNLTFDELLQAAAVANSILWQISQEMQAR
jgi:hypothetical protein